jgi:hypothetical protein
MGEIVVTPNGGIHGNPIPQNSQWVNSFHSNPIERTRVRMVDVPKAKDTQPTRNQHLGGI